VIGQTVLRSEVVVEFWVPNCKECGDPLEVERRGVGICFECEEGDEDIDPYGQPIKESDRC
jgi:hypothetical protein